MPAGRALRLIDPPLTAARFQAQLVRILGATPVAGFMPYPGDTTTSVDPWTGGTWTADASMAGQITPLGKGGARTFVSASSQYLTRPDADSLSFGNGTTDQPFSILALVNITNTAAARSIITKNAASNGEWQMAINSLDGLSVFFTDQSAGVNSLRASDAAIMQGAWTLLGFSYDGSGGATASNGVTLYQNGAVIASTATNNASYVAMENLAAPVEIGSILTHTANYLDGSAALIAACAKTLTAADHAAVAALVRRFYGVPA